MNPTSTKAAPKDDICTDPAANEAGPLPAAARPAGDDVYQTLLESTRAIPWSIDWESKAFTYIGPQIESLLGWAPDSWVDVNDWAARMHPEDRDRVVAFCVAQSQAGTDHEADYRALAADGRYVWIRDVVHVVRGPDGQVRSLVGFMFDITERKRSEEKLAALQRTLEELSYKDGLTGVANRRMFDAALAREWDAAQRSGQPLSLVIMDIDFFKQYNDQYGHVQGDACLRRVAQTLLSASDRERHLLGRFGGEEFILLLPDTDAAAARGIAERCRSLVQAQQIVHARSDIAPVLTLSLGVDTVVPTEDRSPDEFVARVDRLLYQAKLDGRDRMVAGTQPVLMD